MHERVAADQYLDDGRLLTGRRAILNIGKQLLGEPSVKVVDALNSIDDPDRVDRMLDAIVKRKLWKALLAVKWLPLSLKEGKNVLNFTISAPN